jgi:hypothetical protein
MKLKNMQSGTKLDSGNTIDRRYDYARKFINEACKECK